MNSDRSSFQSILAVMREIAEGHNQKEIKSKLFLSRYSNNYIINRLFSNDLIEYSERMLVVSGKGRNVLNFEKEHPEIEHDSNPEMAEAFYPSDIHEN